ncbi:hypothetical protein GGTG_07587 [Gaeumannomyces tritici R3-111a-1]|uniref:Uncharacterized protein n=1 Tax=Gaeumannomyces tritici (strain R3-111a-1) TaxID=644352 RepID=J3P239_GAET3|nr:hypothetical protein GGTG_07587 [Gaeumannomyces tritici R3-111a-1]EJT73731.1 hypothetical protein GGTG_07587 [Gaeumannomyces tritici R3-111a-1]
MPFIPAIVAGVATVAGAAARIAPTVIRAVGAAGRVGGKVADIANQAQNQRRGEGGGSVGDSMHLTHDDIVGTAGVPALEARLEDSDRREQRRNLVGLCGVPQYNFDMCKDQLAKGKQVMSSIPSKGVAKFVNIPPACMNLAVVLSGSCTGEGTSPVPCGSDCMQYTGLNDQQMMFLSKALQG